MTTHRLLIAVLIAAVIMGCGPPRDGADRPVGTLVAGSHQGEIKKLNPYDRAWSKITFILGLTHSKLVEFTPDYHVAPALAESWSINPDGDTITFHLRPDAFWHDGVRVTARDAAFTLNLWKKTNPASFLSIHLASAEVSDPSTVSLVFDGPYANYLLNSWLPINTIILPEHIWKDIKNPRDFDDPKTLIGCGPFIFEDFSPVTQSVTFRADPRYFRGKPSVDRLVWRQFKSYDSMMLSLRKGDIDILLEYYNPLPHTYGRTFAGPGMGVLSAPDIGIPTVLVFNCKKHPMDKKLFREAVAAGIDYQRIFDVAAGSNGRVGGRGFIPPAYRFHKPGLPALQKDHDHANKALDALDYAKGDDGLRRDPEGNILKLEILVMGGSRHPHLVQSARLAAEQLRSIGIDASPLVVEHLLADMRIFGQKDYDVYMGRFLPLDILTGGGVLLFLESKGNMGTCPDARLLSLANEFYIAGNDNKMRRAAWALQDYYAEELPGLALYYTDALYPYRTDRFEGWTPMSSGIASFWSWSGIRPVVR